MEYRRKVYPEMEKKITNAYIEMQKRTENWERSGKKGTAPWHEDFFLAFSAMQDSRTSPPQVKPAQYTVLEKYAAAYRRVE